MHVRTVGIWGLAMVAIAMCAVALVLAEPPGKPAPASQPARLGAGAVALASQPAPAPGGWSAEFLDPNFVGTRYAQSDAEFVSPEQREALGLDDTGWTKRYGKVHPDVYATLEKAEKVKEPWRDPVGHAGTVYVQVQLKHERKGKPGSAEDKAAIAELESKVLSRLSAADFYVEYPMQTQAAVLGYADRQAIEKLKANADVLAVGLDWRPFPQRPESVTKEDLPAPKPGGSTRPPGEDPRVEPEVYRALAVHGRVFVGVDLKKTAGGAPGAMGSRALDEAVLRSLTAEELWVQYRTAINSEASPLIMGMVTREGLAKLTCQPALGAIWLNRRGYVVP
jgi:hypothetical protein